MNRNIKFTVSAVCISLLLSNSCSRIGIEPESASGEIVSVELSSSRPEVKGTPVTDDNILDVKGALKISAYGTEDYSALFSEKELFYNAEKGLWVISDDPQWPEEDIQKFSFWAWSDDGEGAGKIRPEINDVRTEMSFSYAVPSASGESAQMQPDLLFAQTAKKHIDCPNGKVYLTMLHALSSLNFEVDANVDPGVLNSIRIEGVKGSGDCVFDGKEFSWTATGDPESFTQTFNVTYDGAKDITAEDYTKTFMMIPQVLDGAQIYITYTPQGATESMTLTASFPNGDLWTAGELNKYVISNDGIRYNTTILSWNENGAGLPLADFYYHFEVADNDLTFTNTGATASLSFKVSSYYSIGGRRTPYSEAYALAYDAEYSIDGGENWFPFDGRASELTGISGLSATGNAGSKTEITSTTGTKVALTAAIRTAQEISQYRWADDPITATNWDLSKCSIGGEYVATNQSNTANCYIVKHSGSYTIPCVYGNAIKDGSPSDAGYKYAYSTSDVHMLTHFLNSKGLPISSPYVLADVKCSNPKAALMWCDAKDDADNLLIQNVELHNATNPASAYISFSTMDKSKMVEGNAVLVLYDDVNKDGNYSPNNSKLDNKDILLSEDVALWSWHLWVTSADLSESAVVELSSSVANSDPGFMMNKPLGWSAPNGSTRYHVTEGYDSFIIRLKQQRGDAGYRYVYISQPEITLDDNASAVHYQGGRKDPVAGAYKEEDSFVNKPMYGDISALTVITSSKVFPTTKKVEDAQQIISTIISRPDLYDGLSTDSYGLDNFYLNCWSMNNSFGPEYNKPTVKTVYDPSPYGYVIPSVRQYRNIVKSNLVLLTGYGYISKKGLFIPLAGYRKSNVMTNMTTTGYYWTSNPEKTNITRYWRFRINNNPIDISAQSRNLAFPIMPVLDEFTE